MSADPQRFAQRVLEAFEAAGLFTDPQVIAAGGPSTSTMTNLRKVANPDDPTTMAEPREPTWSKVDKAARWTPGSARAVWNGGEPTTVTGRSERMFPKDPPAMTIEDLARRLDRIETRMDDFDQRLPAPRPDLSAVGFDGEHEPDDFFDD